MDVGNLKKKSDQQIKPQPSESRRLPRLRFASVQFKYALNGKIFPVHDLSIQGMSLRIVDSRDHFLFPVSTQIRGILNLSGEKTVITGRVVHLLENRVGCEFLDLAPDTRTSIRKFLSPEFLGKKLRPIPFSESGALWYSGPADTHLFLWRNWDGDYKKMILFLLGYYIQWENENESLTTGLAKIENETHETWGILHYENFQLEADSEPDSEKLNLAKKLILGSNLSQEFKNWWERKLQNSVKPAGSVAAAE